MGDNWELPKPVFRSSSGSLPQDFPARAGVDAQPQAEAKAPDEGDQILSSLYAPPDEKAEEPIAAEPKTPSPAGIDPVGVDIEPQPFISEQFSVEEIDTPAPEKPTKKGSSGFAMLLIGITALIAIVGGILAVVYFLFVRTPPDPTF